jgi:hypothetical protein
MILASKSFDPEEITLAREADSPIKTRIANTIICLKTILKAVCDFSHRIYNFFPDLSVRWEYLLTLQQGRLFHKIRNPDNVNWKKQYISGKF